MFFFSLTLLDQFKLFRNVHTLTSYSIVVAILLYAIIYVYLLFYQPDSINLFTKFIIYVIGVDLILSMLYYYNIQNNPHNSVGGVDDSDSASEEATEVEAEPVTEPDVPVPDVLADDGPVPAVPVPAVSVPAVPVPADQVPLPESEPEVDMPLSFTQKIEETLVLNKVEDLIIPHKKRGRPKQVV